MNTDGVICYLVGSSMKNIEDFIISLESLRNNYLNSFPCTVVAFYEKDLSEYTRSHVVDRSGVNILYQLIEFNSTKPPETVDVSNLGYRHMCNFFTNEIFNTNVLKDFKYYCRLDTDSKILSPVGYDFFNWMNVNNCNYGYFDDSIKNRSIYCVGLWESFDKFVKSNPQFRTYGKLYRDIPERSLFYTNFEICNISWFKSEPWQTFASYIVGLGGIYNNGWGDHNIRYAGVKLYMEPSRIKRVPIHYYHQKEFDTR